MSVANLSASDALARLRKRTLSSEERAEHEAYVMAASVVAILQAKARARLTATS